MAKSIITIETEDLLIDGVPHVKRVLKKNDNILHEDIVSLKSISKIDTKINMFMDWVEYWENRDTYVLADNNIDESYEETEIFE